MTWIEVNVISSEKEVCIMLNLETIVAIEPDKMFTKAEVWDLPANEYKRLRSILVRDDHRITDDKK